MNFEKFLNADLVVPLPSWKANSNEEQAISRLTWFLGELEKMFPLVHKFYSVAIQMQF